MGLLKPDGTSDFTKLTDGLKALLFDGNTDLNVPLITEYDAETFFQIHQKIKNDPGNSKRMRNIRNIFREISKSYPSNNFKSLAG